MIDEVMAILRGARYVDLDIVYGGRFVNGVRGVVLVEAFVLGCASFFTNASCGNNYRSKKFATFESTRTKLSDILGKVNPGERGATLEYAVTETVLIVSIVIFKFVFVLELVGVLLSTVVLIDDSGVV